MIGVIPKFADIVGSYQFRETLTRAAWESCGEPWDSQRHLWGQETAFAVVADRNYEGGFRVTRVERGLYDTVVTLPEDNTIVYVHFHPPHADTVPSYDDLRGTNLLRRKLAKEAAVANCPPINPIAVIGSVRGQRHAPMDTDVEFRIYQETGVAPLDLNSIPLKETIEGLCEAGLDALAQKLLGHVPRRQGLGTYRNDPDYLQCRQEWTDVETAALNHVGSPKPWYRVVNVRYQSGVHEGKIRPEDSPKLQIFSFEPKSEKEPELGEEEKNQLLAGIESLIERWNVLEPTLDSEIRG